MMTLGGGVIPKWIRTVCARVVGRQWITFCSIEVKPISYEALL